MTKAKPLTPGQLARVTELVAAAEATDGVPPLSDQTLLRLREGAGQPSGEIHLFSHAAGEIVGYGNVSSGVGELVVDPGHRRQGHGRALVEGALANADDSTGLKLWAHGNQPGAVRLAERYEFRATRKLWQLRRPLNGGAEEIASPELLGDIRIRHFRPGADEIAWLELNRRAFAGHPEQGQWSLSDITGRENEPWFDPTGFLLAERTTDSRLLGFHWTKIHRKTPEKTVGEVYVLGVDPGAQGLKLGKILLVHGLRHLANRGCEEAMLYVDASNQAAAQLYHHFGFARTSVDVQYERSATRPSPAAGSG